MPCYHPIKAWRSKKGRNPSGSWPLVFKVEHGYKDMEVQVPCGQCIGCRLERSRQWAVRCVHESKLHVNNCFVTLTYNDLHAQRLCMQPNGNEACSSRPVGAAALPGDENQLSLNKRDFVLFMKKLRRTYDGKVRFFHCGEYGERFNRPHHHACLFGFDFQDKILLSNRQGVRLYRSAELEKLWPYGYSTIGEVNFDTAAYVARYCVKKITGKNADEYYDGREPEYVTMSRRPGIGAEWYQKFKSDVESIDGVVINNLICRPPKYYDKIYDKENPGQLERRKVERLKKVNALDNTPERLLVKEQIKQINAQKLKRLMEETV